MRLWIDTDIGTNPDDTIALWCAAHVHDATLVGVSTVDGNVEQRAEFARAIVPGVDVIAGPPPPEAMAMADVLLGIGPWTHVAALADVGALPLRVVMMGGVLGPVVHRGVQMSIEYNLSRDAASAARLLRTTGNLIVVPLDATARVQAHKDDEAILTKVIPGLGDQLKAWRAANGPLPLVLHDPAALFVALGERVARLESRRLVVAPDGTMSASVDGPLQRVVAYVNAEMTRERVHTLAVRG